MPTSIIVHERIATWTGRLRPRFAGDARVRWVESRSSSDLVASASGLDRSIVLVDLAERTMWGMEGLEALSRTSPTALILVLDPDAIAEVPPLARELGATVIWSGVVVPPRVESLLRRWLDLIEPGPLAARSPAGRPAGRSDHT